MERKVDVAIIGAGTAGLHALSEVRKETEDFVLINGGPLGTVCARVGCMPSKVLIQVADDFHRRRAFADEGIDGGDGLRLRVPEALACVRRLRDRFVGNVVEGLQDLGDRLIDGYAEFVDARRLRVGEQVIVADRVVIATGSRPVVPDSWRKFGDRILTTDSIFEQQDLPHRIAVLGLGPVGLEIGQALARMGCKVTGFDMAEQIGGLQDPEVSRIAVDLIARDVALHLGVAAEVTEEGGPLRVGDDDHTCLVDKVLVSVGRKPNLDGLHLERLDLDLDEERAPPMDPETMQVASLPVFMAGDVACCHAAILHEAAHDGRVAGYNAVHEPVRRFARRVPLGIAFTDPNICAVGQAWPELDQEHVVVADAGMDDSGRAIIMQRDAGIIRLYAARRDGRLLGAALAAPQGEHLAHLLAWSIQDNKTVLDLLKMPFYHPVIEESLADALRRLAAQIEPPQSLPPDLLALGR